MCGRAGNAARNDYEREVDTIGKGNSGPVGRDLDLGSEAGSCCEANALIGRWVSVALEMWRVTSTGNNFFLEEHNPINSTLFNTTSSQKTSK